MGRLSCVAETCASRTRWRGSTAPRHSAPRTSLDMASIDSSPGSALDFCILLRREWPFTDGGIWNRREERRYEQRSLPDVNHFSPSPGSRAQVAQPNARSVASIRGACSVFLALTWVNVPTCRVSMLPNPRSRKPPTSARWSEKRLVGS